VIIVRKYKEKLKHFVFSDFEIKSCIVIVQANEAFKHD